MLPARVTLYEVGPRDGLQNESANLSLEARVRLVEALADASLKRIEIGSFVRPDWIPQLADTDQLARRLVRKPGVRYAALVPNRTGLDRAVAAGMGEVAVFMSATESHNRKNTNKTVAESLEQFREIVPDAKKRGLFVRGYLSTIWGCPYEGKVDLSRAVQIARELRSMGCDELSLGDTIGVGNPRQTREIVELFLRDFPPSMLALHMHDTHGTALANCLAAMELGVTTFDTSIGGMGGCPYAPGAAGNLATEDLVSMLADMGIDTGAGKRAFCAGANLKERQGWTEDDVRHWLLELHTAFREIERCPKPWIAAINGVALGGGCELALACDLRVMDPGAEIGLTETKIGVIPGGGGTVRLSRIAGTGRAKDLILTARRVQAAEALQLGVVSRISPAGDSVGAAVAVGQEIAGNAPVAVAAAKASIDEAYDLPMDAALEMERLHYEKALLSEDRLEGLKAFAEKRPPRWRGR